MSLLNQLEDGQHHTRELWSPDVDVHEDTNGHVTGKGERAAGWGYCGFILQQHLNYHANGSCQYFKDNTLFFRVDCFELKLD